MSTIFPGGCLELIELSCITHFQADPPFPLPPNATPFTVIERPLKDNDPARSIGVFATDWMPGPADVKPYEIGQEEPVIQRYQISVQLMIRGGSQIETRDEAMTQNKLLRAILYRDPDFRVPLSALSETMLGATERFQKFTITGQRFLNAKLASNFAYLSTTICTLETETTV